MVRHESDITEELLAGDTLKDVKKKILIGPKDGYKGYLRVFSLSPGGFTPHHKHNWWHANYVLEGEGKVIIEDKEYSVTKGSTAYIENNKMHQFRNTGNSELKFICLVPEEGDSY